MGLTFPKPPGIKYTDMAIYIDAHVPDIARPGEHPDVETTIFIYLYHMYYMLACKAHYFKNINDYDGYAIFAATDTYFALRDKYNNAGVEKHGKIIEPVKSSLNYVKSRLYPFRVDYQQKEFFQVINPEENSKHETEYITETTRESIRVNYSEGLKEALEEEFKHLPQLLKLIIKDTPYKKNRLVVRNLYYSCLLSFINTLILPKKVKDKIQHNAEPDDLLIRKTKENFDSIDNIILWHLDESFRAYVKILLVRLKMGIESVISSTKESFSIDESLIDEILKTAYSTYSDTHRDGED